MADQSVRIESMPDTGKYNVALKLMHHIADAEYYERGSKSPDNPREYYLELFAACRRAIY